MYNDIEINTKDLKEFIKKRTKEKNPVAYNYANYLKDQIKQLQDELNKIEPKITSSEMIEHFTNNANGKNSIANYKGKAITSSNQPMQIDTVENLTVGKV